MGKQGIVSEVPHARGIIRHRVPRARNVRDGGRVPKETTVQGQQTKQVRHHTMARNRTT